MYSILDSHEEPTPVGGSFRDPAGFVYLQGGKVFRRISPSYVADYDKLMESGLYEALTEAQLLVRHVDRSRESDSYRTIEADKIPYVSYPYEWSFGQLKQAALLTLDIQRMALKHGLSLKDASAYNVQFIGSRAIFIDTLSFESYPMDQPWVAYGQFCRHFLGPLALMRKDVRLAQLLRSYIDGVPLDLCSKLLPWTSLFRFGLLGHVHLHAYNQKAHQNDANESGNASEAKLPQSRLLALLESLRNTVEGLELPNFKTEWGDYYEDTNYSNSAMSQKEALVLELAERHMPTDSLVHDLGANTGRFSRLLAQKFDYVVSHDIDELAIERNFQGVLQDEHSNMLPLLLDLTNPSPALGWNSDERDSSITRLGGDSIVALALIHHLAIGNNLPLRKIAEFFGSVCAKLLIEFVPKEDSQVQRMLATREDIFPEYDIERFTSYFERHFTILERVAIDDTERTLFVMELK